METSGSAAAAPPAGRTRNFAALAWHGTFLAAASALVQPTTLLPAYVASLGGSPFLVGLMVSVLLAGSVLPELWFARGVEASPRKKPHLLVAVYSRAGSFLLLGALTLALSRSAPALLLALLLVLLAAYSLGGSLGSVAYTEIYGKSIEPGRRGRFYASRQLLGSLAALAVSYGATRLLQGGGDLPRTYAVLFLATGGLLAVAGMGFAAVVEPAGQGRPAPPLAAYLREAGRHLRADASLRHLVAVENLSGLHLMLLPFYVLLAQRWLHATPGQIGLFTMAQVLGGALSNLVWGSVNDRRGSAAVLRLCLVFGSALPGLALVLARWAPGAYGLVFVILGAAVMSRNLSFTNLLVDLAPPTLRATYTGLVGTLTAPSLVLPMVGGTLIGALGFAPVFWGVAASLFLTLITLGRSRALAVPPRG
jgi:MFS family permease